MKCQMSADRLHLIKREHVKPHEEERLHKISVLRNNERHDFIYSTVSFLEGVVTPASEIKYEIIEKKKIQLMYNEISFIAQILNQTGYIDEGRQLKKKFIKEFGFQGMDTSD